MSDTSSDAGRAVSKPARETGEGVCASGGLPPRPLDVGDLSGVLYGKVYGKAIP